MAIIKRLTSCICEDGYDWRAAIEEAGRMGFGDDWRSLVSTISGQLASGLSDANTLIKSLKGAIEKGANINELISVLSGFGYQPGTEAGDLVQKLTAIKDLKKLTEVIEHLSSSLSAIEIASNLSKGGALSSEDAAATLSKIYEATSSLGNIPAAGSYLKFIGKSLEAITKGIAEIQGGVDVQNLSDMLDSCEGWMHGPTYDLAGPLHRIWRAGVK